MILSGTDSSVSKRVSSPSSASSVRVSARLARTQSEQRPFDARPLALVGHQARLVAVAEAPVDEPEATLGGVADPRPVDRVVGPQAQVLGDGGAELVVEDARPLEEERGGDNLDRPRAPVA